MKRISINEQWSFQYGDRDWFARGVTEIVDIPHDFIVNLPRDAKHAGQASNGYFADGRGVYEKKLDFPAEWEGKAVYLAVDGAYMMSEVRLNQTHLAFHPYGYTAYLVDLSGAMKPGRENTLWIGTQSRQPSTRWYSGGGLYRDVSLWVGEKGGIGPWDAFVTAPSVSADEATIRAEVRGEPADSIVVLNAQGQEVARADGAQVSLAKPHLWDVDDPYLYRVVVGAHGDTHEVRYGVRDIQIDSKEGFRLNGKPMKLAGGCVHHDNGPLGAAAFPAAEERKVRLLKEAGYNSIRCAHNPPSEAMLDACDRLGMLVMDEAFDCWMEGKVAMDYHVFFRDWWERDIESMVLRDRNHPCVFSYSIGNEIVERDGRNDGAAWAARLADKVRSLDPTRPVTSAINGFAAPEGTPEGVDWFAEGSQGYAEALDIVGYNYLHRRYDGDSERCPERVFIGTETFPFDTYNSWQATKRNPSVVGDFIWTSFDYMGEAGIGRGFWPEDTDRGFCGQYPWHLAYDADFDICGFQRPQSFFRQIMWNVRKEPYIVSLHPKHHGETFEGNEWRWDDVRGTWNYPEEWIGKPTLVQAYADADEVEFFLNGQSKGRACVEALKATITLAYEPGTIEAVAYRDGKEINRWALSTTQAPAAIRLSADRAELAPDGRDLAFVSIELVDAQGRLVTDSDTRVTCAAYGEGTLKTVGSADPLSEETYGGSARATYEGRALAILQAAKQTGTAHLVVTAPGLPPATIEIPVK